jgi:hypothetical protein
MDFICIVFSFSLNQCIRRTSMLIQTHVILIIDLSSSQIWENIKWWSIIFQKDKLYFWKKFFVKQISDFPDCPKCIKKGVRIVMSEDNGLVCPLCDSP